MKKRNTIVLRLSILVVSSSWAGSRAESPPPYADGKVRSIVVDKGRIRVKAPRGGYLPDADLLGAKLVGMDEEGRSVAFRIDSIIPYRDSIVDMTLYSFSSPDSLGHWNNSCGPDRMGRRRGFVMEGYFDAKALQVEDSSAFTVTCTSGSAGKCVLFGYGPWLKGTDGSSIKPLFQACTRMVRADYCGDGTPHTRNGTFIELWDYKGIQGDDHRSPNRFEASWAPEGAVWIKRTRIPEVATLDSIAKECPERYRTKMSVPSDTLGFGEAVLFNRSR